MRPIGTRQAARRTVGMQLEMREWSSEWVCAHCADTAVSQMSVTVWLSRNFGECGLCRASRYLLACLSRSQLTLPRKHSNAFVGTKIIFTRRLLSIGICRFLCFVISWI